MDSLEEPSSLSGGQPLEDRGKFPHGFGKPEAVELPGFPAPIEGMISQRLSPSDVRVGVLADQNPTSLWYLGMSGRARWVVSGKDVPGRVESDPPRFGLDVCIKDLERINVLVVQGKWPAKTSRWWIDSGATLVIRVSHTHERGGRRVPETWKVKGTVVRHDRLGGVTNGAFKIWYAVPERVETPILRSSIGLKNTLCQVLKPTEEARKWVTIPTEGELNTGLGLLRWGNLDGLIKAPSVFRKEHWASRLLTRDEKQNVLDFPESRSILLPECLRETLLQSEIPGKVWVEAFVVIPAWIAATGNAKKRNRDELGDLNPRKRLYTGPGFTPTDFEASKLFRPSSTLTQSEVLTRELTGDPTIGAPTAAGARPSPESTVTAKAVKSDNAAVPVHLWNDRIAVKLQDLWKEESRIEPPVDFNSPADCRKFERAMDGFRVLALRRWKRNVRNSFRRWFGTLGMDHPKRESIWRDGQKACAKADQASWWEWDEGSSIFFWRWPDHYMEVARSGVPPYFDESPPVNQDEQPPYADESVRQMVKKKLEKVVRKGYIELCDIEEVEAMMYMFHVPKGADDIRMVYDGSKSGLNNSLWAPWFALPNVDTMARWCMAGSWLADNDYGEQFLNFPLHEDLQRYCGVDLTQLFPEWKNPEFRLLVGRWTRNAMGLRPSPYNSVQGALIAKYAVMGDLSDAANPFGWETLRLNLPGSQGYDATLPWIMKIREDGKHASGLSQYIDDLRVSAASKELAWQCSSRMAKGLAFLGLQDAARKRRECTQSPGAWAGAVISTQGGLFKSVTQERWEKTQLRIRQIGRCLGLRDEYEYEASDPLLDQMAGGFEGGTYSLRFKALESATGFLVYVGLTYHMMVPYFKGLHLTLNSWRPNRDEEGWKLTHTDINGDHGDPPDYVNAAPRLIDDIKALMELTRFAHPPKIPVRPLVSQPTFLVGDASGMGFGVSRWRQGTKEIDVTHGNWALRVTLEASSNFREAANLVLELRRLVAGGQLLRGSEVWVFTDNSCAEKTFYKGQSTSRLLHEMVVELRKLEMEGALIIHFVWFSGKRMIAQGTDGLSRGDFTSGVMAGEDFLKYIPLNESALERQRSLEAILLSWVSKDGDWRVARPEDWFTSTRTELQVGWIWAPPPCLARVALDELCEVKHMFPHSRHIFVCPALMTGLWRKDLGKLADVVFNVSSGQPRWLWDDWQFEPLTIAFVCPLLDRYPWAAKRSRSVENWRDNLSTVLRGNRTFVRGHMRKLWRAMASGKTLSRSLARPVLSAAAGGQVPGTEYAGSG